MKKAEKAEPDEPFDAAPRRHRDFTRPIMPLSVAGLVLHWAPPPYPE